MTAIVILAAGSSSRMGSAKQNLVYKGKTLLQTMIMESQLVSENVVVLLGAGKEEIAAKIQDKGVTILDNCNWEQGMATSITLAIDHLLGFDCKPDSIIFLLCDQPYVNAELLNDLIATGKRLENGIIASKYSDTVGVPALFKKQYFPGLLELTGKDGAKKLFEKYKDDVVTIPFPLGAVDIDTEADYKKLIRENNHFTR
jgi:molybdenum cofactor cytidylyltransferase